ELTALKQERDLSYSWIPSCMGQMLKPSATVQINRTNPPNPPNAMYGLS
ncbi:MAG: hypothetical protein ACJAY2_003723, partial [Pseudomonadales bacterium]